VYFELYQIAVHPFTLLYNVNEDTEFDITNNDIDKNKIIKQAAENTYSINRESILVVNKSYNLWSVLSLVLE
jgi:hypothetical protein